MNQSTDDIFELTLDLDGPDPREALWNDYHSGVRGAKETLELFCQLQADGLIRHGANSPWWKAFLRDLMATVEAETSAKY